jgi:hypothetical protein
MALRSVEHTFPAGDPHFRDDFCKEFMRLASTRIGSGGMRVCASVAIAEK